MKYMLVQRVLYVFRVRGGGCINQAKSQDIPFSILQQSPCIELLKKTKRTPSFYTAKRSSLQPMKPHGIHHIPAGRNPRNRFRPITGQDFAGFSQSTLSIQRQWTNERAGSIIILRWRPADKLFVFIKRSCSAIRYGRFSDSLNL